MKTLKPRLYGLAALALVSTFSLAAIPRPSLAQAAPSPDLGDAPDSGTARMTAYPGVTARFPTVFGTGVPAPGPLHRNEQQLYILGKGISVESAAEGGADSDKLNNITPAADQADNDLLDDGLRLPARLDHCTTVALDYLVSVPKTGPSANFGAYLNLWVDWDRDGAWEPAAAGTCAGGVSVHEWAVENFPLSLRGGGVHTFKTPRINVWNPTPEHDLWLRLSLSDVPAPAADGHGPAGGYGRGETEDYRYEGRPALLPAASAPDLRPVQFTAPELKPATFLPLAAEPSGPGDPPLTAPGGALREVDVAHIGGTSQTELTPLLVTAAGTGSAVQLTSWSVPASSVPQRLADGPVLLGHNPRLRTLSPALAPGLLYSTLLGGTVRGGVLWLTTYRLAADGSFVQLSTRGYGGATDTMVAGYALAHRQLQINHGRPSIELLTPIITAGARLRIVTWHVDAGGAINGLSDSGDTGASPFGLTNPEATAVAGGNGIGPYYVVSYRDNTSDLATQLWEVASDGTPIYRGAGTSGVNIRGTSDIDESADSVAIARLTGTGFVSALERGGNWELLSWENRPTYCNEGGCLLTPHRIARSNDDLTPDAFRISLPQPAVTSDRVRLIDTTTGGGLFQRDNGSTGQQGIASLRKILTLIVALEAVENGEVSLDDDVVISEDAADWSGSSMGIEEDEVQALRNLMYGMMMVSAGDATYAIHEHVAGTTEAFAERMRNKAAQLGMSQSVYCDPVGACYSTPDDQITLWLSAYQDLLFQEFAGRTAWDACGMLDGDEKCYFLQKGDPAYPGVEGWKDGDNGFTCPDVDATDALPLCASGGCLSAQATRLGRTLALNLLHPQPKTGNRWPDARALYDYGYQQLFTPDHRASTSDATVAPSDMALDNIEDDLSVTAVVDGTQTLSLCAWRTDAAGGQTTKLPCGKHQIGDLAAGMPKISRSRLDVEQLSTVQAEGDYVVGRRTAADIQVSVWRVAQTD